MTTTDPSWLRLRAGRLHAMADQIEALPIFGLEHLADETTWRGARPHECLVELAARQRELLAAIDHLNSAAWTLVQHAERIEHQIAIARAT